MYLRRRTIRLCCVPQQHSKYGFTHLCPGSCRKFHAEVKTLNDLIAIVVRWVLHGVGINEEGQQLRKKNATHTFAYFCTSFFSFSAPLNTLRMSWTQPSPDNFTSATPAKIGEWKRRSSATSPRPPLAALIITFTRLRAHHEYATLRHHRNPRCIQRTPSSVGRHIGVHLRGYGYYSELVL